MNQTTTESDQVGTTINVIKKIINTNFPLPWWKFWREKNPKKEMSVRDLIVDPGADFSDTVSHFSQALSNYEPEKKSLDAIKFFLKELPHWRNFSADFYRNFHTKKTCTDLFLLPQKTAKKTLKKISQLSCLIDLEIVSEDNNFIRIRVTVFHTLWPTVCDIIEKNHGTAWDRNIMDKSMDGLNFLKLHDIVTAKKSAEETSQKNLKEIIDRYVNSREKGEAWIAFFQSFLDRYRV